LNITPEQAQEIAAVCIHCPDPAPCQKACPVENNIPEAMWLIEEGDFLGAAAVYREQSTMPEICGR
ncbi:MAG: dihydropyrimidine dehydrogenase, partial [Desulfuromonadales bacterium]|nr:dihydropyrimidine dehydrogenase [Desulfuromonadales bacterium]NIS41033.1 dihydropyrimidine dehydrogenase [Desulfuromonadales bacterium]